MRAQQMPPSFPPESFDKGWYRCPPPSTKNPSTRPMPTVISGGPTAASRPTPTSRRMHIPASSPPRRSARRSKNWRRLGKNTRPRSGPSKRPRLKMPPTVRQCPIWCYRTTEAVAMRRTSTAEVLAWHWTRVEPSWTMARSSLLTDGGMAW